MSLLALLGAGLLMPDQKTCPFRLDDRCVALEKVSTEESRRRGLSGRKDLNKTAGMLFDFREVKRVCIWMKEMNFPLDIIWLDESRKITKILEDVEPGTYPESFCQDATRYVIELNAGTADGAGLKVGQKVDL